MLKWNTQECSIVVNPNRIIIYNLQYYNRPKVGIFRPHIHAIILQAGLQIDLVNSYSKGGSITTTFYKISTLLDVLDRSDNFFAPRLLCSSETRKIEDRVLLWSVFPITHFRVECLSRCLVCMACRQSASNNWKVAHQVRMQSSTLQHLQLIILSSKNDQFTMYSVKNHPAYNLKQLIALFRMKFDLSNHSETNLLL